MSTCVKEMKCSLIDSPNTPVFFIFIFWKQLNLLGCLCRLDMASRIANILFPELNSEKRYLQTMSLTVVNAVAFSILSKLTELLGGWWRSGYPNCRYVMIFFLFFSSFMLHNHHVMSSGMIPGHPGLSVGCHSCHLDQVEKGQGFFSSTMKAFAVCQSRRETEGTAWSWPRPAMKKSVSDEETVYVMFVIYISKDAHCRKENKQLKVKVIRMVTSELLRQETPNQAKKELEALRQ